VKIKKLAKLELREIQALGETLDGYAEFFKTEIANDTCELWEIDNGKSFAITRLENDEFKHNKVLVVCCYKGENLNEFVEHITAIADKNKWLIRFHTKRPALVRWMKRKFNFNDVEYVAIRENNHG